MRNFKILSVYSAGHFVVDMLSSFIMLGILTKYRVDDTSLAFFSVLLYNFCASILRAGGDTKRPLYYMLIGGVVKVTLNYICVAVFDMTVAGVGIATIVSNTVMCGFAFHALLKNKNETIFRWK